MASTGAARKKRRATVARWAYWIHGIAGLKLGIVLALVIVTGTLAVLGHEWDWLFGPYQRVAPEGEAAGLAGIHAAIREQRPELAILRIEAPRGPRSAAMAIAVSPERQFRRVYVDPYRLTVRTTGMLSVQQFLRQTHQRLLLPAYGRLVVSALAVLTLTSLVSGMLCYKRFWRGFLRVPRRRDLRTFLGDCHRLAAVWSLWFLAIMAVTGLWYFYEELDGFGAHLDVPDLPADAVPRTEGAPPERISMAAALASARATIDGFTPHHLMPPENARDPIEIEGTTGAVLVRPRASVVAVNPYTGEVVHAQRAGNLGAEARLHEAADPLHFGTWGGIAGKLVWFLFGVIMSFLSISGIVIHAKRLAPKPRRRVVPATQRQPDVVVWDAGVT
jgi:uncharacterized iron-regulated membrane protein